MLKSLKYQGLVGNVHFQPVAFETTGCCGPSTGSFFEELGKKLFEAIGTPLEAVWLHHKVSLVIVRSNATSILFCLQEGFDEILSFHKSLSKAWLSSNPSIFKSFSTHFFQVFFGLLTGLSSSRFILDNFQCQTVFWLPQYMAKPPQSLTS